MADDRRIVERLVAADRSFRGDQLPPRAVHRIWVRMAGELDRRARGRRFGWIPMLTFVAGAAAVLLVLVWGRAPTVPPTTAAPEAAFASVSGRDCHQRAGEGEVELSGACEVVVREPGMRIATIAATRLGVVGNIVQLREGSALFDVARVRGDPVRIVVPGGAIVVVGTRFRVEVDRAGGKVELFEGRLEFHADDGSVTPIEAGQQLAFGTRTSAMPPTPEHAVVPPDGEAEEEPTILEDEPAAPEPTAATSHTPTRHQPRARAVELSGPPPRTSGEIIDDVQALRRRGDYEGAAGQLRAALGQRWPIRTAEVLSYELGTILARHLGDAAAACHHWREHLQRFGGTRHRDPIEASMARLGCE